MHKPCFIALAACLATACATGEPELARPVLVTQPSGVGLGRALRSESAGGALLVEGRREGQRERRQPIASLCPVKTMTCYPGCATVADTLVCGPALVTAVGTLAAALAVLAAEQGVSAEELCRQHSTLCTTKAEPTTDPKAVPTTAAPTVAEVGKRPCLFVGAGGDGLSKPGGLAGPIRCTYSCGTERRVRTFYGNSDDVCRDPKNVPTW